MTAKTQIWDALSKTDPAHTKKFKRAGGFSGTAIKPIYMTHKMTEQFGACGEGWGMTEPRFTTVPAGDCIMVYCTVAIWHDKPGNLAYGVGGDVVLGKNKNGPFTDDEAFKKAYTDALSNAMKQLGVGADVHMGQHDDDKYTAELRNELAAAKITSAQKDEIVALIKDTDSDTSKFLAYIGAESVDQIGADQFARAKAALERKAK